MEKTSIELRRDENHPKGYGNWNDPTADSSEILDRLINWAQRPENLGQKIYRHVLRIAEEKVGELGEYDFSVGGWSQAFERGHGIQRCHRVIYLDIYHQ
jgi:hypothetical protein